MDRQMLVSGLVASTMSAPKRFSFLPVKAILVSTLLLGASPVPCHAGVVHSFLNNGADGIGPLGAPVVVGSTLYGATIGGGSGGHCCGTLYSFDPATGAESVAYSFCSQANCADGGNPGGDLIYADGILYGSTENGGKNGTGGTVFAFDPSNGTETTLYSFCSLANCADGLAGFGRLLDVNGILYGITYGGGSNLTCNSGLGCGTLFSISLATGTETTLYSFCSQNNCADGAVPKGGLIDVNGVLYGTTFSGGSQGKGTVYSIDPSTGAETVVYSFCSQTNCSDGANPDAPLLAANGTLYGTTENGGANGGGTMFSLDPTTGSQSVVYSFCSNAGCSDGSNPVSALIDVNGMLLGTTAFGGNTNCNQGCGTLFGINPTTGQLVNSVPFCQKYNARLNDCKDGSEPFSDLLNIGHSVYGSTFQGGRNQLPYQSSGTLFKIRL